jgi:hypothetical protein
MNGVRHIGAISGGKDSVCMAVLLKETRPEISFEWVCTPTGNEPPEWYAHMAKLRDIIGPITPVIYKGGLEALINKFKALPNWRQRWCTRMLKIEPFAAFLMNAAPAVFYVGLRSDEEKREGGDYQEVPNVQMAFPLRDAGMGIAEVWSFLDARRISIPARTDCMLCFFQRLIEWFELWRDNLAAYELGEYWEAMTGATFRSPGRDTQPTALRDLRLKFEGGFVPSDTRIDKLGNLKCRVCRM